MNTFFRMIGLLLTLLTLCGLIAACGTTTPPEEDPFTFSVTEEFIITRPTRATDAEEEGARAIRDALTALGISVRVQEDWYADIDDVPAKEILVGATNREESADILAGLADREYAVRVWGSEDSQKIVVTGKGDRAISAAVDYFITTYLSAKEQNKLQIGHQYNAKFEFPCENIVIGGAAIGDYSIVYAKEGVTSPVDPNYQTFIQTAKYKDAAEALADAIEEVANARPKVVPDTATVEGPIIYFGKTDLSGDDAAYTAPFRETGSFKALLSGNDIILAGDNACAAYAAGEALIEAMCTSKTELTALNVADSKRLIKVACVGDSITHGFTSDDPSDQNYPVYLQKMLGYDYYVEKYGAPGFSLCSTDTFSYMSYTAMYKGSQDAKPDVVIIMLGTNDCNPFDDYKDWSNPGRAQTFTKSAETMISAYRRANPNVQIYLMTPPTVPQNRDWSANVKTYAVPLITDVAKAKKCELIDIHAWSLKNTKTFTADGGDGLHPKNHHYGELAEAVYDGLKDTIRKPVR